jgi:hypothetical protein
MRILILVVVALAAATEAAAQRHESALFLEGAFLGDHEVKGQSVPPMTVGGGGAIGFQISRHFSLRFEAEAPLMHTVDFGDQTFSATDRFRTTTYSTLAAGHYQPHRRVTLAFLGGLSAANSETRRSVDSREYRWSFKAGALTAGVDAAVALTPHLAIVPEVRFHAYNEYSTGTRPKVAIRWTF